MFEINKNFTPKAGQEKSIESLVQSIKKSQRRQTLLGATGTGKTFMMAETIKRLEKAALVIAPNKTLAAQLYREFSELFPENAVEYFVSYYDYYQPEAYVVAQDLFIEKDAMINEEIDRMRHRATEAVLTRPDTIIVASVSAIYGLGDPKIYKESSLLLEKGSEIKRKDLFSKMTQIQYQRNDTVLKRSGFSSIGDRVEIWPSDLKSALRLSFWGDEIEKIELIDPLGREVFEEKEKFLLVPASHYTTGEVEIKRAVREIAAELDYRMAELFAEKKNLEAARLEKRVEYDIEMLEETGFVSGIENYSRIFDQRSPGDPPFTLLDYFPDDFLCFLDESHVSVPQLAGMYKGDRSRKETLVDHGFRLKSALDNRPLKFDEFLKKAPTIIAVTATPGEWEKNNAPVVAEQLIRPTGIIDPEIEIKRKDGQIEAVLSEIEKEIKKGSRTLITTITKKMAEELADFFVSKGIKAKYLHSDVDTLERIETIFDLRLGRIDVLVGVNLLREGLDIPEVSLVVVLDADQEGFLRNETSLIQTAGRAARNARGRVIFFADKETDSIKQTVSETERRRKIQKAYNKKHSIVPQSIEKTLPEKKSASQGKSIAELEKEMAIAADELRFEDAADIRDEIEHLSRNPDLG